MHSAVNFRALYHPLWYLLIKKYILIVDIPRTDYNHANNFQRNKYSYLPTNIEYTIYEIFVLEIKVDCFKRQL